MRRHVAVILAVLLAGCNTGPSEPQESTQPAANTQAAPPPPPTKAPDPPPMPAAAAKPKDPLDGKWTLADATKDLKGTGALVATIDTSKGKLTCKLYDDKAPLTVANFVGLSTGKRAWLDPSSGQWVNKPAYDGTTFHRIIKDFMIQGGDPKGDGSGEPGYVFPDELWAGGAHDRAGLLCMANRGANTNGSQFFITDSDGPSVKNLDRMHSYTIFGECSPVDAIHAIAGVPTGPRDKPLTPVTINSVKVARGAAAK
jgi:peptidyl-prolyl cis-trans isomerase A (cyclophilin A)